MNKSEWYKFLFARVDSSIENNFYFEASFICYGIIEDRLNSLMDLNSLPIDRKGVGAKIADLKKVRSTAAEALLEFSSWDGGKYNNAGRLEEALAWGTVYRNPMQHNLGDPRKYKASVGDFHSTHTRDMAIEGKKVARDLSSTLMRYKRYRNRY